MNQLLPILIPVGFALFWSLICFLIVLSSGWRSLHEKFRADHTPQGHKFLMQSAHINSAQFSGVLTIIVAPQGLYLKVWPLFTVFGLAAKPVLIPWSELSPLKSKRWAWSETWTTQVRTGRFNKITITFLSRGVAQAVMAHLSASASP